MTLDQPAANQVAAEPAPRALSLRELLRRRHEGGEWVLLEEVAPATGGGTRYADAVAINLWSSRGHAIVGFEIKDHRSDWLRELKNPAKAEPIMRFCNTWWIVAQKGIVRAEELPLGWGLLEPRGQSSLAVSVPAAKLSPVPVTTAFFASLIRRAFETIDRRAAALVVDKRSELEREFQGRLDEALRRRTREGTEAIARLEKIQEQLGMPLDDWRMDDSLRTLSLAKAMQKLDGYDRKLMGRLEAGLREIERIGETMRTIIDETRKEIEG